MSYVNLQLHQGSFFAVLHYDIRQIIYTYLLPEDIPPFVAIIPETIVGFSISCKLAYGETLQPTKQRLDRRIEDFTSTFAAATKVTPCIKYDLRNFIITLPFHAFHNINAEPGRARWKREVITNLHPFFTLFFDTVRIHVRTEDPEAQPDSSTPLARAKLEVSMQSILRDLTYVVERVQRAAYKNEADPSIRPQQSRAPVIDAIFKYTPNRPPPYPSDCINAERICLTWDLRPPLEHDAHLPPPILNGKLHHLISDKTIMTQDTSDRMRLISAASHKARSLLPEDIAFTSDNSSIKHAMVYQLRDSERLSGEMGIVSLTRWTTMVFDFYLNRLVNGRFTRAEEFYCEGFGGELRRGLKGMTLDDFENEEKEVSRLLHDT